MLDRALEPALEQHFTRVKAELDAGNEARAHEIFFDFRVADLAMGSGHFLVSAVDRIESAMRNFLVENNVPGVSRELQRLEAAAKEALGDDYQFAGDIDKAGLLRRQIARRCIYGLDINPLAVELSRLALWIHTFVPGLPMSSLDHGLVCANSLTGIGTIHEALEALEPNSTGGQISIFEGAISDALDKAKNLLIDAANADEANKQEVKDAAKIAKQARKAAESTKHLFDAAVAARLGEINAGNFASPDQVREIGASNKVQELVSPLNPAHMPYLFPEVFLRDNPGFDVLLGNPPWEKLHVNSDEWWSLRFPELKMLNVAERAIAISELSKSRIDLKAEIENEAQILASIARVLASGPFPGIGSAHIDLYAAFAWRNTTSLRESGYLGLLVPRTAFSGASLELWRRHLLSNGVVEDLTTLKNSGKWMFDITEQYTVAALSYLHASNTAKTVTLRGPFSSAEEFLTKASNLGSTFESSVIISWTDTCAIPMLPSEEALNAFSTMRSKPDFKITESNLGGFRPVQGDINQTTNRNLISHEQKSGHDNLAVWTGRSFNLWNVNTGQILATAEREVVEAFLIDKRLRTINIRSSATYGLGADWATDKATLPLNNARIVFRDICRATDERTFIATLAPPGTVLVESTPYLFNRSRNVREEAYLLGLFTSIILDWYTKFFVELHLKFYILNSLPIPAFDSRSKFQKRLIEISGKLAAVDERYSEWAEEVGVSVGSVTDEATKEDLIAELDALGALLYGLDESQVTHIFETFHRGWDYKPRLEAVLKHFHNWKDKK